MSDRKKRVMSTPVRRLTRTVAITVLALMTATVVRAQLPGIRETDDGIKYARGQNVVPVFEGWVPNPDGTISLVFGTWNRNWEETVFIPVGPDNHFDPGGPDRGQPTAFAPRRGKNLFEVVVPKDFGDKEVVWTLTSRGKTEKAYGKLVKEEVLTRHMVLAGGSLNAAAAAGNDDQGDESDPNKPPAVTITSPQSITGPGNATVAATITDDGVAPRGGGGGGGRARKLRVNWSVYRGPGVVIFKPERSDLPAATGGQISTVASFKTPGTYVLRATATDVGGLETNKDVTVVVK